MSEINFKVFPVSEILHYMSGNQGLTKKAIHNDKSQLGTDDIMVLSSSLDDETAMGYVSRGLVLNGKPIKIFEEKEGILVSRNGNAGILTYLPKGKYTMNDHAYILFVKDEYKDCIDMLWLSYAMQQESLKYISVSDGNKTWNITRFMREGSVAVPIYDDIIDLDAQKTLSLRYRDIENKKSLLLSRIERLKKIVINFDDSYTGFTKIDFNKMVAHHNGNAAYTKEYCQQHKGPIPVFSANNNTPIAYMDSADYSGEFLTYSKNGCAGYITIKKGDFSVNGDRCVITLNDGFENIDLYYLKYYLEPIFRANIKGRMGINGKNEYTKINSTMIKKLNLQIPIPVLPDGSFDIAKQKEIAQKYATIESIKQELYNQVLRLTNIVVE